MRKVLALILILWVLPSVLAISLTVEKQSSNEVLILGSDSPVVFDLEITNLGSDDNIEFYNLLGFQISPAGRTPIGMGETKSIQLQISPIGNFDYGGFYKFTYYIRGQDFSEIEEELIFKSIELKDAFEVGPSEIDSDTNSLKIYLENKEKINFGEINAKFSSAFFNFEETFSLGPNEKKEFGVQLDQEKIKKLMAGFYTLSAEINVNGEKVNREGTIKFLEKNLVTTSKKEYGLFINTEIIEKTNEGNVLAKSETAIKKNVLSRLFTSFSPEPNVVQREGLTFYYLWDNEIKPGETLNITVKTNWLFPLIIILFIIAIVVLAKQYSRTNLVLRKRISFVRAKGGEFALKVSVFVHAKKYVEKISVTDRLPPLIKVYEKFLGERPTKVDEANRRIQWSFEKLEEGEKRVVSYIIYSKVGIVGKFALPSATAIYERDGEIHESESNKAFFVAEQRKDDLDE